MKTITMKCIMTILLFLSLGVTQAKRTKFVFESYNYIWGGSCYEVDIETNGEQFKEYAFDTTRCRTSHTVYKTHEGKCYEVDKYDRKAYAKEVDSTKCGSSSMKKKFLFESYNYIWGGSCYEVDAKTNGKQFKEYAFDTTKCRTSHTVYKTHEGTCYEVDKYDRKAYAKEVDSSKCGY